MKPCRHSTFVEGCRICWLARYHPNGPRAFGLPGKPETPPEGTTFQSRSDKGIRPSQLPRKVRCVNLGVRLERRAGCNGMMCRHACDLDLPAVPAGYCQACEKYEGDFNEDGSGPGWLS